MNFTQLDVNLPKLSKMDDNCVWLKVLAKNNNY